MGASKTFTGDFGQLTQLAAELENLSQSLLQMNQQAAQELETKAKSQFRAARGPDDKNWKLNQDGQKPLQTIIPQVHFSASTGGITESVPEVAKYHQDTRPMIPVGQLPLPWQQTLENSYRQSIDKIITNKK